MRVTVFGVGYVGLVTGTCLAELGHDVLCVDIDPARIDTLRGGRLPIYEPGLWDLVKRNVLADRLRFEVTARAPYDQSDAYIIAVGTPPGVDGAADVGAVLGAADTIAGLAQAPGLVIVKSTVPVGTCDRVQERLAAAPHALTVVSNPEFLAEGTAIKDFFYPDRVVIGARDDGAANAVTKLYAPLGLTADRVLVTDPRSSELVKYASNTMLAMRVSFMNEMSRLCDAAGADIHAVRLGVGADVRIGKRFLYAGAGYGGSCFPKDVQALAQLGKQHNVAMRLAEAAHRANEEQAAFVAQLVRRMFIAADNHKPLAGRTIALWGLAFKPETDDVREAPAVRLAVQLLAEGARVVGHDPEAADNFKRAIPDATVGNQYEILDGADALVLLTEWRCYRAPNFVEIKRRLAAGVVIDARNVWAPADVENSGLQYQGLGTLNPARRYT